ncbi:DUF748 domain-containing protein [Ancylomarina sp. YFZ004]
MKYQLSKGKKILISVLTFLFILFFFLSFFLSSLVKHWAVNNSEDLIGRKVMISELHFNYAQAKIQIKGFKLLEENPKRLFIVFEELLFNFSPYQLLKREYAFSNIYLDGLKVFVVHNSIGFNFDDIIRKRDFGLDETNKKKLVKFSLEDIQFKNGYIKYTDLEKNNIVKFEDINLKLPLIAWNNNKSEMGVDLLFGNKGKIRLNADMNHALNSYSVDISMQTIDLNHIKAYLTDYLNINAISGRLNSSLQLLGSLSEPTDFIISGQANIGNIELRDTNDIKLFEAKLIEASLDSLNLGASHFELGKLHIDSPEIFLSLDTISNNYSRMISPFMRFYYNLMDSLRKIPNRTYPFYKIDNISVSNGLLSLATDSLKRDFVYDFEDIDIEIDRLHFRKIDLDLPWIAWNRTKSKFDVDFKLGNQGKVGAKVVTNHARNTYEMDLITQSVDLDTLKTFLKDYLELSSISGQLNTNLQLIGRLTEPADLTLSGQANLTDLIMKDSSEIELFSARNIDVTVDSLNPGTSHFDLGGLRIDSPIIYFSIDTVSNNFRILLSPPMQTYFFAEDSLKDQSDVITPFYQIDSISLSNGLLSFVDQTMRRDFVYDLKQIDITLGTLSENEERVPFSYSMNMHGSGRLAGEGTFSMKNAKSISIESQANNLDMMSFSPYSEYYFALPINQGILDYKSSLVMNDTKLNATNTIHISSLAFGKKMKEENAIKAPIRLALYILKDNRDQVNFELPVTGNPSDPDFRLGRIISKALLKFMLNAAGQPFNILGHLVGANPKSIKTIPFHFLQDSLDDLQKKKLNKIALVLSKKEKLRFSFIQETNLQKEKELLALKSCISSFCTVKKIALPDVSDRQILDWWTTNMEFIDFLKSNSNLEEGEVISALCIEMLGEAELDDLFLNLLEKRNRSLQVFMQDSLSVDSSSFEVKTADLRNMPELIKSPNYRVEVSLK